ncbi:hypothetical protein QR680_003035 [Steinernema hermaphroditum]|uniref:Uncharacterized protein n=1 Tax=Steinernema hermaphroditum TaxID=289476 RepID=A0AA39H651_9BILA|nr:hypothetical protein QR680_003035 [Steinernema hermaphroditum]
MGRFILLCVVSIVVPSTYAIGGLAELKAITGDAPYLGIGNQETAGEVYYSRSGGMMPYANYMYNRPYYQQYNSPYGIAGNTALNSPPMGVPGPGVGRFYQGIGNSFINRQK